MIIPRQSGSSVGHLESLVGRRLNAGGADLVFPKLGKVEVVRESATFSIRETIDWQDPRHLVQMDRFEGDNAASADLRSWADVYTPGQPGPQRTLTLYQVKAEGRQQAQDVNLILSIYDKVAAAVQRFNAGLRVSNRFDLIYVHMTTARYTDEAHKRVKEKRGMILCDRSNLNIWCPPMHNAPSLWRLDLRRRQSPSPLRSKAVWRPMCLVTAIRSGACPLALQLCVRARALLC